MAALGCLEDMEETGDAEDQVWKGERGLIVKAQAVAGGTGRMDARQPEVGRVLVGGLGLEPFRVDAAR